MSRRNANRARNARRSVLALAVVTAGAGLVSPHLVSANTLTWDNNADVAPNPQDGPGAWDTSALNFFNGTNVAWNNANNDTAVFGAGGTGGAVTLSSSITIGGLQFDVSGYTLSGGELDVAGTTPVPINVNSTGTISTVIGGSGPVTFNVAPTAALNLNSANTFTGGATLTGGGTLDLRASGSVAGVLNIVNSTMKFNDARKLNQAINVDAGNTGTILLVNNGTIENASISGAGTIVGNSLGTGRVLSLNGDNSAFTGTFTTASDVYYRLTTTSAGSAHAVWDLTPNAGSLSSRVGGGTIQLGALLGDGDNVLRGSNGTGSSPTVFEIGGHDTQDSVFMGAMIDGNSSSRILAISKIGANRIFTVGGTNTYTGNTYINAGTFVLAATGSIATSPNVFVENGGSFDVTAQSGGYTIPAGQTLQGRGGVVVGTVNVSNPTGVINPGTPGSDNDIGSLTIQNLNVNGGTVSFDLGSGTSDLINASDSLTLSSGALFVNSHGNTGTFRVINYPANSAHGSLSNLSKFFAARTLPGSSFTDDPANGHIDVTITGFSAPLDLTWNSTSDSNWDVQTSANWASSASQTDMFFANDAVHFNDGAGLQTTIVKVGSLQPSQFTIGGDTTNYSFGGSGTIDDPSASTALRVMKSGLSTASFTTANSFTGGAQIDGGTLRVDANGGIGSGSIDLNSGSLYVGTSVTLSNPLNINASGVTLAGNGSLTGAVVSVGNTVNLNIASGSTITMVPGTFAGDFVTGTLDLGSSNGTLRFASSSVLATSAVIDLGTASATLLERDGNGNSTSITGIAGGPGTTIRGASSSNNPSTFILGVTGTFGTVPSDTTFAGQIVNGSGGSNAIVNITKRGTGYTLTLSGNNTYTGTTNINQGTLLVNGTHTGGGAYTVASGAALGGSGNISASINAASARLTPGATSGATGNLTVGSLTLGGTQLDIDVASGAADQVTVTNPGGLSPGTGNTINLTDNGGTFGHYVLIDYNGPALGDVTAFSPQTFSVAGQTGTLTNNTINTSVDLVVKNPSAVDQSWNVNGGGSFSTGTNWSGGSAPSGIDSTGTFGPIATGAASINVSGPATVGFLQFNTTSGSYTLDGAGPLTFDVTGGYTGVTVESGNQSIKVPVVLSDNAIFAVNTGGTLNFSNGLSNAGRSITKSGAGELHVANVAAAQLNVTAGKLVVDEKPGSPNSTAGASVVNSLNLSGGTVDLTNNALIIDYTTLGSTLADTRANLAAGKLTTSLTSGGFALGYADASAIGRSSFAGVSLDGTDVIVGYTYSGDANLDGTVNALDFNAVASNFGAAANSDVWTQGDFNYDGAVDTNDFTALSQNFGKVTSVPAGALGSVVPEPASLGALALLGLLGRRRRSR